MLCSHEIARQCEQSRAAFVVGNDWRTRDKARKTSGEAVRNTHGPRRCEAIVTRGSAPHLPLYSSRPSSLAAIQLSWPVVDRGPLAVFSERRLSSEPPPPCCRLRNGKSGQRTSRSREVFSAGRASLVRTSGGDSDARISAENGFALGDALLRP